MIVCNDMRSKLICLLGTSSSVRVSIKSDYYVQLRETKRKQLLCVIFRRHEARKHNENNSQDSLSRLLLLLLLLLTTTTNKLTN
jgi:hypothetical protein